MLDLAKATGLILQKLQAWLQAFISDLPNLLVAIVVLIIGLIVARHVRRLTRSGLARLTPENRTLHNFTATLAYAASVALVIFMVLQLLHLGQVVTTALAGAGIAGLGIAFAFRDIAANFISGIFLMFRRPFHIGDAVKADGYEGFVESIELRDTTIRTYSGQIVTIPNREVLQNPIVNFTRFGKRRADVTGSVSKSNDLRHVREVALAALAGVPGVIPGSIDFLFEEITDSVVHFHVQMWVASDQRLPWQTFVSEAIITVNTAFQEHGVEVSNDHYTLDMGDGLQTALDRLTGHEPPVPARLAANSRDGAR
ncbi:MAG TPA: mechanosensitive ion channel [Rhodanobacteraceae bacterium]